MPRQVFDECNIIENYLARFCFLHAKTQTIIREKETRRHYYSNEKQNATDGRANERQSDVLFDWLLSSEAPRQMVGSSFRLGHTHANCICCCLLLADDDPPPPSTSHVHSMTAFRRLQTDQHAVHFEKQQKIRRYCVERTFAHDFVNVSW